MRKSTFLQTNAVAIAAILAADSRFNEPIEKFQQLEEEIRTEGPYSSKTPELKKQKCIVKRQIVGRIEEFESKQKTPKIHDYPAKEKFLNASGSLKKAA